MKNVKQDSSSDDFFTKKRKDEILRQLLDQLQNNDSFGRQIFSELKEKTQPSKLNGKQFQQGDYTKGILHVTRDILRKEKEHCIAFYEFYFYELYKNM